MEHIAYCDAKAKELQNLMGGSKTMLTEAQKKRWIGKRYLCLIGLKDVTETEPFSYVREKNMDDWIIVESIDDVMK